MDLDRRRFLRDSLALPPLIAALFAAAVTVSCDDGSSGASTPSDSTDSGGGSDGGGGTDGVTGSISANHGHTCEITQAELDAGDAVTLTLTLASGHTHTLDLTALQVQDIAAGSQVTETSSVNGHSHDVTFN